jgi:hypothetical protein
MQQVKTAVGKDYSFALVLGSSANLSEFADAFQFAGHCSGVAR